MRYLSFLLFIYFLVTLVYAGPNDRWVPAESVGLNLDGIALILAIAAFAWVYVIYKDFKRTRRK